MIACALAHGAQTVVGRNRPLHDPQHRSVKVGVYHAPGSGALSVALVEQARHGLSREYPGQVVGNGKARPYRGLLGVPGEVRQPSERGGVVVETGVQGLGSLLAVQTDAGCDQSRVEPGRVDIPALQCAGSEVLTHHVGYRSQTPKQILALRVSKVDGHRLAPPAFYRPVEGVGVVVVISGEGPVQAGSVAEIGVLDLQHLRALFAQDPGAERGRDPSAHIKHSEPGQRLPH